MRRWPLGLFVVLGVLLSIVASAHAYFIRRLVIDAGLGQPWAGLASATIVLGAVSLFAHPISERSLRLRPPAAAVLGWPAYLWLGASFYLLVVLGASDLVLLLLDLLGVDGDFRVQRALVAIALVFAIVLFGVWNALLRGPQVKRVEIAPAGWPPELDGYRIVQISDVHIGTLLGAAFARRVTERCNALRPDAVVITGDLVDGSVENLVHRVEPFAALRAKDGVHFVTGNHDHYSGADRWTAALQQFGFKPLRNRHVRLGRRGAHFVLAGVDDYSSGPVTTDASDLERALDRLDGRQPVVLLAHDPRSFEEARTRGVALQLSGHTHAGQMWPFGWLVRLQTRYVRGAYRSGSSQLYVNRGTGFWGPPLRVFAPGEITELVLRTDRLRPGSGSAAA